jgi:MFS transporter, PPP family, 3-phenylpropionic acid transporter
LRRRTAPRNKATVPASAVAIALYYAALFGALGLYLPYFGLYLSSVGLSDAAAVQVQVVVPLVSLVVPPLLGALADARRARVWLLRGFSAAAAVAFAALPLAGGDVVAIAVIFGVFATLRAPLVPLADATAHEHVRHHGGSYGRLRTWGSFGYLVTAVLGGTLYRATSMTAVIWATTAALGLSVLFAWRMPAVTPHRELGLLAEIRRLLRTRSLWLFLIAVAAAQAANTSYDSAVGLHLKRLGYGADFLGVMIAIGVAAETALLAVSGRLLARLGAERTLVIAFAVAAARWLLMSMLTSRVALLAQAPLHGFTFGLYWVSATTLMREYAGPRAAAAGQGLLGAATAVGGLIGLSNAGRLLERGGGALMFTVAAAIAAFAAVMAAIHAAAHRSPPTTSAGSI